jgi:hypothetical protein
MEADLHVLGDGQVLEQLHQLIGAHQPALCDLALRQPGDVRAVEGDAALGRREEARDGVEQRGLAGAVRADHGEYGFLRHSEADRLVGEQSTEALGDVLDREEHQPPSGFAASRRRHSMPGSAASPLGKKIRIRISTDA